MPQNVPAFEFSDRAKDVRAFVFAFWCDHGRGPTLREVLKQAHAESERFVEEAKASLAGFPDVPARQSLLDLADFVVQRDY